MTMHAVIRPVSAGKNPGVYIWDSRCAEYWRCAREDLDVLRDDIGRAVRAVDSILMAAL